MPDHTPTARHTLAAARSVASKAALVLETNNLRGGAGLAQAVDSLKRLVSALSKQSVPPVALAQWIITHDGLPADACAQIAALAGRPIDFVEIGAHTGYYDAKNDGFDRVDAARCDYVVFGDADCRPADDWLEHLLAPFARDDGKEGDAPVAVAGRTSYAPNVLGIALTSIDFMYFPSPLRDGATRNFYANNVAFRHDVFAQFRYEPLDGVYRAHCQVMGLRMQAAGVAVEFAPAAHTEHRLPDTHRESLKLRWMRGEDSVGLTPYLVNAYLPRRWQWLGRSGPLGPFCVMAMRLGYSLRALNRQQLPRLGVVRYLAVAGVTIAASAVDTLGALARGFGLAGRASARRDLEALSYHRH
ncbi:glycosyltransferase [Burkholderia stabilis]|uniref:glycosyltransferase n=1 Tax=Burkholderia stabilis TaxID=95485 RepID=UPI001F4B7054|nr:glycosyltransferase family 2 protein [Burkholderia stabilis]